MGHRGCVRIIFMGSAKDGAYRVTGRCWVNRESTGTAA